jgi:predicted dehydrogenase
MRRGRQNPPDTQPPDYLDYEFWTGPAPMRPYNELVHPGGWRGFMEYGNGIMGDMCIHMFDMVRWMLDLGWPRRIASTGGIFVHKDSKPNISDTQTATWEYDGLRVVWQHRTYGHSPDPKYWWGANLYGDQGTLKATVFGYEYTPIEKNARPVQRDVTYELEQYPEDKTEPRLEKHVAPAIRHHMKNLLAAIDARSKPVADIEQGYISTTCCILANLAMKTGRTLDWDAERGRIANDEEANRLLRRPYRSPWVHPEAGRV